MSWGRRGWRRAGAAAATGGLAALTLVPALGAMAVPGNGNGVGEPFDAVIVQAPAGQSAADLVARVLPPGLSQKSLDVINGVAVTVPHHFVADLVAAGATVTADEAVSVQGSSWSGPAATCPGPASPSTPSGYFTQDTGSDQLVAGGDNGAGTTVAVIDTGINGALPDFAGRERAGVDLTGGHSPWTDEYGHGTFVAGLIAGNGAASGGRTPGEAPGAQLVSIKAAGASGIATVSSIVQGIDFAVKNQRKYGIGVLNLSFGAVPTGPTAAEPMDQAVEAAWKAGIAVVVSAGNAGPFNGTVLSPGDDPLVITVGAYADNDSPQPANWAVCPFSSVGPTLFDGWMKPDLVAPGRSVVSVADPGSTIYTANPSAVVGTGSFVGSGTSFSAAITSGAAALVLAAHPGASPNELKGRLLGNAMPGPVGNPFVDGHGLLNAYYAATGPQLVLDQTAAAAAESTQLSGVVSLGSSWSGSSWNGSSWNGSSWNGSSWNGSSWNGSSWNGSSWNGSSWNGSSWNGSSWNGSSWNGSSWNGSSWNGSSWNGSSWNGSSWNGSSWNGSSWNGSSWTGSSLNGSSWIGSSWNGSSWNGSSWN
ncbi:MAG TPA: S8 family serine peptidase [Acidimicrobiales bacterium]|nr:S8 family serine peptidase [Acidimicrobiales bacterium]